MLSLGPKHGVPLFGCPSSKPKSGWRLRNAQISDDSSEEFLPVTKSPLVGLVSDAREKKEVGYLLIRVWMVWMMSFQITACGSVS